MPAATRRVEVLRFFVALGTDYSAAGRGRATMSAEMVSAE